MLISYMKLMNKYLLRIDGTINGRLVKTKLIALLLIRLIVVNPVPSPLLHKVILIAKLPWIELLGIGQVFFNKTNEYIVEGDGGKGGAIIITIFV